MTQAILILGRACSFPMQLMLAVLLFASRLEKRTHWVLRVAAALLALLVGLLAAILLLQQASGNIHNYMLNYLPVTIGYSAAAYFLSALFAFWICQITFREAIFCAICAYLTQHFAYCFTALVQQLAENVRVNETIWDVLCFGVTYVVVYFLCAEKLAENGHYNMQLQDTLRATASGLGTSLVLSAIAQNVQNQQGASKIYLVCLVYAMTCCFYMLYAQVMLHRQLLLRQEANVQQQLFLKSQSQFDTLSESMELINRKCHDLKHQITVLRSLPETQREESLHTVENAAMMYDAIIETGNKTLNVVLTEKNLLCIVRDIQFTCIADGTCLDFMDPLDIYAMFGNALDNAIEAVSGLSASQPRSISLHIMKRAGMILVQVENPYEGELQLQDGLPKTSKENELGYHGYGVKSIQTTAEKYGGFLTVETQGGVFVLRLVFPQKR